MTTFRPVRLVGIAIVAVIATTVSMAGAQARPVNQSRSYYLSLGDSLAFGYQPNLVAARDFNPADYRSYAEDFAAIVRPLTLVNYGCPGETTSSLMDGGCPWAAAGLPLHDSDGTAKSQLGAAEAFLGAHPGQVPLVTINIGSNDLLALVTRCQQNPSPSLIGCLGTGLTATVTTIETNYAAILTAVRSLAPSARIVIFNLYNPLTLTLPGSEALLATVNQSLAGLAAAEHVRLADAFAAINGVAGAPLEAARICTLTWECTAYANIHPTTLGYASLTEALIKSLA